MPRERVVEFKVACHVDVLPELIYFIGKTKAAMFESRPEKLPRPRDPALLQKARKIDELISPIVPHAQPRQVSLPLESLEAQIDRILQQLEPAHKEVMYYLQLADELKAKLAISRELAAIRAAVPPKTEALEVYVVLPGRAAREAAELAKSYNALLVQHGGVQVIAAERRVAEQLKSALQKLGARVFTLQEVSEIEPPEALEDRLRKTEEGLRSAISRHRDMIDYAYTLRNSVALIAETFSRSAIDEGVEAGRYFGTVEREIERMEEQLSRLKKIKLFLDKVPEKAGLKLPEGFRLYIEPETPIAAPHTIQEIGGIKVAIVRGEARGIEIPAEYLSSLETGRRLVEDAIKSTEHSIHRLKRELEIAKRQYREFSVYGDMRWGEHRDVASITFYVLERDVKRIDDALAEFVKHNVVKLDIIRRVRYKYLSTVPAKRRPTLEKLPTPIKQLATIVYWYGMPKADEVSPTIFLALMFVFYYGWMYGDLGHGLLMTIFGVLLMKWLFGGKYKSWGIFWATTGAVCMLFGALVYHEIFGFGFEELGVKLPVPPVFHLFEHGWAPAHEGVYFQLRAIFIMALILLLVCFTLRVVNFMLKGERDVALGVVLPNVLAFWCFAMILFTLVKESIGLHFLEPVLQVPWHLVLLGAIAWGFGGALTLRMKYRHHEEAPPVMDEAIIGIIEGFIAAFANIASYSRLLIIILMHGVFTKMANEFAISLGMPLGFAAAAFFHLFIAFAEGFVSLIQSLRLVYYEMASKFYEAGGRPFTPLAIP